MIFPANIYSLDQLTKIVWEIDEGLAQLRGSSEAKPQFSTATEKLFALNNIRSFDETTAVTLRDELESARKNSKEIHISTGSITSPKWREEIVQWLRNEIDGRLFCSFSSDTAQGGGIIVRTPKRQYDMTFKHQLLSNSGRLVELLK